MIIINTMKKVNLVGQKFGRLLILKQVGVKNSHKAYLCQCDCGNQKIIDGSVIKRGSSKSCGCLRKELLIRDVQSQKFGRLTAIRRLNKKQDGHYLWLCKCDCGNFTKVGISSLVSGNTQSCGCSKQSEEYRRNVSKRMKGQIPWNKGKTGVYSKEMLLKMSNGQKGKRVGIKSPIWKGNDVGYGALHDWVRRHKGQPKICIDCGATSRKRRLHWSNIDHKYRRRLDDYQSLCVPCHKRYDLERGLCNH